MVGGPGGGISVLTPTRTGTGGARHYAALVFGKRAWCAPRTNRNYLLVPLTGLADLIKVVGPPAVEAVVRRLAPAVTRVHCCVQACTGCLLQGKI